jgi:hypothetical protein
MPTAICPNEVTEKLRITAPNITQRMIDRFMCYALPKIAACGPRVQCRLIVPLKALLSLLMFLSYKHKIPEDVSWWKAFEM